MADLTKPMSAAAIKKLDYFERAQLYHNVYSKYAYKDLPYELKTFYNTDSGLKAIQAIASTGSIQNPYTLIHLLRVLMPEMPKSYQHIYKRAEFLADMCDTSVENILRSRLFLAENFIPDMITGEIDKIIKTKGTGTYIPLEEGSYTPDPDAGKGGGSGGGGDGDFAEEEKVYFYYDTSTGACTCSKTYAELINKVPKLPAAEIIFDSSMKHNNVVNISCSHNTENNSLEFNFIQIYDFKMTLYQVVYTPDGCTIDTGELVISKDTE